MTPPNTPGLLGYVIAYAVAVPVFALAVGLVDGGIPGEVGPLGVAVFTAVFVVVYGSPVALIVIPLVHLTLRNVEEQAFHVTIAGFLGFAVAVGGMLLIYDPYSRLDGVLIAASGAVSTAVGRAVVIPLVHRRRRPEHRQFADRLHRLL